MVSQNSSSDILFDIKNSFYIGHFQHCCNEAAKAKMPNKKMQLEKDVFYYRACLALRRYGIVLKEIPENSPDALSAIRMFALYLSGDGNKKAEIYSAIIKRVDAYEMNPEDEVSYILPLVAAYILFYEKNYDGLTRLFNETEVMEIRAVLILMYLNLNRIDFAQKMLKKMKEVDEDCTITQLCQGWIYLNRGKDRYQEAFYVFQELAEKYFPTPMLLSGQASALIGMERYEEADPILHNAISVEPEAAETLINLSVLYQYLGRSTESHTRNLNILEEHQKDHHFLAEYHKAEREFDRLCKQYSLVSS